MLTRNTAAAARRGTLAAITLLTLLAFGAGPARAFDLNGFLRARGTGTVALSYTSESYDHFWVGTMKVEAPAGLGEITTDSSSLWFAYGFTDKLTLFGNAAYVQTDGDGTGGLEESDFQDLSLLVAYRLPLFASESRHSLVGAVGLRTPLSNYVTEAPVAVGDGTDDALFRLVYQFRTPRLYVSQQLGYDLRSDDAPDGYPLLTEVGVNLGQRLTLAGFYQRLVADDGLDISDADFAGRFPQLQEELERAGAKLYVRIGRGFGASVAYFTTLDGRNTGDASGVSGGVVYDF